MPKPPNMRPFPLLFVTLAVILAFAGQLLFARSPEPSWTAFGAFVLAALCLLAAEWYARIADDDGTSGAHGEQPEEPVVEPEETSAATALPQASFFKALRLSAFAPLRSGADQAPEERLTWAAGRFALAWLLASVAIAVGAQLAIAIGYALLGLLGYGVAVGCAVAGAATLLIEQEAPLPTAWPGLRPYQFGMAATALAASAGTFALSGGNRYRLAGVVLWIGSIVAWWLAWGTVSRPRLSLAQLRAKPLVPGMLVAILLLGALFRFVNLDLNPLEMGSDHAEKLLDVHDVLNGTTYIFFERNTGREPWQFYWTAMLVQVFNLPPNFMTLKIGTALVGWLMLPAIFLLGREVFGTRIALLATLFAAVASWAVIPARFGLRYPLAPCAVAWTMYFLVRGLRRNERNAMLAAGIWMGIGLQGYTAYRFMPVVFGALVLLGGVWHFVQQRRRVALQTILNSGLALVMTLLMLTPLLRYGFDNPDSLFYRMTSRLSEREQTIDGNAAGILLDNLANVLRFFNYTYDVVPVVNLPQTPAMDVVLGALLVVGAAATVALSSKSRNPWPVAVLGAGVLMLFPSALSLAYPGENPSIVRTGGAIPMLMIVAAVVPGMLLGLAQQASLLVRGAGMACVALVAVTIIGLNTDRVFRRYPEQYCAVGRNASDIARELAAFVAAGNDPENAWIVGYPHWVDYRAVGDWIGDITYDNEVFGPEELAEVDLSGAPGWFALNSDDTASLALLQATYPRGVARTVVGTHCPAEQFVVFTTQ